MLVSASSFPSVSYGDPGRRGTHHPADSLLVPIDPSDVSYLEAGGGETLIMRRSQPLKDVRPLATLFPLFRRHGFLRVHRNHVVNLARIRQIRRRKGSLDWKLKVISKEQLVQSVWGGDFVTDEALTYAIHELRKALGDDAKDPRFIQTFPKKGYQLIGPVTTDEVASHKRGRATLWGLLGFGVLAVGIGVVVFWPPLKDPPRPLERFVMPLPSLSAFGPPSVGVVALSPDGSHLAYVATGDAGKQRLYLRPLDETEASPMPGTEDAYNPFFSPDGQWIGFTARKQLKKVSTRGGAPLVICDCDATEFGASWGPDGTIVFRPQTKPLMRVSALGGAPQEIKPLPDPIGRIGWGIGPEILPNGKAALVNAGLDSVGVIGERFVMIQGDEEAAPTQINVILNWLDELERLVPTH